jgi:hypothetical protein
MQGLGCLQQRGQFALDQLNLLGRGDHVRLGAGNIALGGLQRPDRLGQRLVLNALHRSRHALEAFGTPLVRKAVAAQVLDQLLQLLAIGLKGLVDLLLSAGLGGQSLLSGRGAITPRHRRACDHHHEQQHQSTIHGVCSCLS